MARSSFSETGSWYSDSSVNFQNYHCKWCGSSPFI